MDRFTAELRAAALIDQGIAHRTKGEREKAIACFREAWQIAPIAPARNNWAAIYYEDGDAAAALQILGPLLEGNTPLPYTHALASLCHSTLGQPDQARRHLQRAIRDFDAGRQALRGPYGDDPTWVEYGALIKTAACRLGDHRLVLDLHSRWPGRDLPTGAYAAGLAAFNLGKYAQAVRCWARVRDREWVQPLQAYCQVATLVERGLIPPFELDDEMPDPKRLGKLTAEEVAALPVEGGLRLLMLVGMFAEADKGGQTSTTAQELIRRTGEWGVELGRRLLRGSTVPLSIKFGAALALTELGVFRADEPIPIVHEGRATDIRIKQMNAAEEATADLEAVVDEARWLWDQGRRDEALKRLTALRDRSIAYPPAMLLEAHFLRERGQMAQALTLLQSLERVAPDQPAVQFQLALLHLQCGDLEKAHRHAEAIDPRGTSPAFQRDLARLRELIEQESFAIYRDPAAIMEEKRDEVERQPINLNARLASALRRIPVQWLNAAAAAYQVPPLRRRPEREKALAAALLDPTRLRAALDAEEPQVRAALRFLLDQGGWVRLPRLTKRFGGMKGDGFYWDEAPPASTLGRLRLLGLVFVGVAGIDGRNCRVAVVPVELRPLLAGGV